MSTESSSSAIHSDRAPQPVGLYPHARRVGNLLLLSGVGPRQRGTSVIPGVALGTTGRTRAEDFTDQCLSTFANVRFVLEEAGASWEELVDVTVFLTDMAADFPTFNALWAETFKGVPEPPCRTTVEVGALPTPIAIELKCLAAFKG